MITKKTLTLFLCAALSALITGCTHNMAVSVKPTAFVAGEKLPLHAALVLDQDLAGYKHEFHLEGDTWVYPFGPTLQDYARRIASTYFPQVDEFSTADAAFADTAADIVLIPRAVKSDESVGVWAASKMNFTLVVEWAAKDRASQNILWLKTITADASETGGNGFTYKSHQRKVMQKLFDDLNIKTSDAFQHAPELSKNQH